MKKAKYVFGIVITLTVILTSLSETISQNNNMKDRFYIGPINFYFLEALRTQNHRDWYSQLSYNSMQNYCGHFDSLLANWGTQKDGGFFEDTSAYAYYIRGVIKQWYDSAQINSLILEREKILRAAFGQRSTYQAEYVGSWVGKFPAYGFDTSDFKYNHDVIDNWMDDTVISKYCQVGIDTAGFMVKGLVDNCEQTNDISIVTDNSSGRRLYSDIKQLNYANRWYIKPRMRIDSIYAKANPDTAVVMVYVKNFNGDFIDSTLLKCKNFIIYDENNIKHYNGRYIENYYNLPTDFSLSVMAYKLAEGFDEIYNSKVDYQIKWLGKVDVWLDYVRVDDSWAHSLFTETYESEGLPNNNNPWKFHRAIHDEVTAFKNMPGLASFWVDECWYNNIPCIAEVNRLVKYYSGDSISITFIADPQAFVGGGGLRYKGNDWSVNWGSVYDTLFRMGAISNQIICQFFPQQWFILYPSNLTLETLRIINQGQQDAFPQQITMITMGIIHLRQRVDI